VAWAAAFPQRLARAARCTTQPRHYAPAEGTPSEIACYSRWNKQERLTNSPVMGEATMMEKWGKDEGAHVGA
jgi:hypothetical protein